MTVRFVTFAEICDVLANGGGYLITGLVRAPNGELLDCIEDDYEEE